jgi:hypothetical protein
MSWQHEAAGTITMRHHARRRPPGERFTPWAVALALGGVLALPMFLQSLRPHHAATASVLIGLVFWLGMATILRFAFFVVGSLRNRYIPHPSGEFRLSGRERWMGCSRRARAAAQRRRASVLESRTARRVRRP